MVRPVMGGPGILLGARWGVKLLRPKKRRLVRVAKRIHALQGYRRNASNSELWDRLGEELPEWASSGVVSPLMIDRLRECLRELDPDPETPRYEQTKAAREELRCLLNELYEVLTSSDPITRQFRDFRHAFQHERDGYSPANSRRALLVGDRWRHARLPDPLALRPPGAQSTEEAQARNETRGDPAGR